MWFLGFLFAFSLLALPLFIWLKGEAGRTLRLAAGRAVRASRRHPDLHPPAGRGAAGSFTLLSPRTQTGPISSVWRVFRPGLRDLHRRAVHPGDPARLADPARRRPRGHAGVRDAISLSLGSVDLEKQPLECSRSFCSGDCIAACGWCWAAFMLFIGMRFLDSRQQGAALRPGDPPAVLRAPPAGDPCHRLLRRAVARSACSQAAGRRSRLIRGHHRARRIGHQARWDAAGPVRHEGRTTRSGAGRSRAACDSADSASVR